MSEHREFSSGIGKNLGSHSLQKIIGGSHQSIIKLRLMNKSCGFVVKTTEGKKKHFLPAKIWFDYKLKLNHYPDEKGKSVDYYIIDYKSAGRMNTLNLYLNYFISTKNRPDGGLCGRIIESSNNHVLRSIDCHAEGLRFDPTTCTKNSSKLFVY